MSFSAIIALLTAALRWLASVEALVKMIVEGNVIQRLESIEKRQALQSEAAIEMAKATTEEERLSALRKLSAARNA
jgi:hypothetical protein